MKIVCESCGAKYSIADEKVAGKVFKIRCKKCSAVIVVKGDQPTEGAEAAREFDYGSDAIWHVVVGGEQQGPFAPRQIGELLAEGKIDWEAYVWREGMEGWQPAKDVEPLVKAVMAEAEGGNEATKVATGRVGEIFGGSNDMGADPFASSSDDGGLSGVIGQQVASATAAGGGADLFADSNRSAFAAAAAEDDDAHAGGMGSVGGGSRGAGEAPTGQRNENSVLFSLSNLQALATGSGAAPAAGRPKPGMAQGEGSGLIDIRALASATQAVADRPNGSSRDKVEDLLAVGSSNTTFSATSLAAPVATEKTDHGKTMLYAMAAAILLLGGAVTYLVLRPSAPQPIAAITQPEDRADDERLKVPAAAAAAPAEAPTEAPQAAEPSPPEPAAGSDDSEKSARADDEGKSERGSHSSRRHSGESSSRTDREKDKEKEKPEPVAAAEPPSKKTSSGDKSLDDLLSTALGDKPKAASKPAPAAASENLQATPSRDDVLGAMKGITPAVQACGAGQSGVAMAKVGVTGSTGKVSSVDVSGQFAGSPIGSCVAKEVRKAKFPKFSQSSFSFSYPFKI